MARAKISALLARQKLAIAGVFFVVAANMVAFGDAGYPFLSTAFAVWVCLSIFGAGLFMAPLALYGWGRAAAFAIGFTYFLDVMFVGSDRLQIVLLMIAAVLMARVLCGPRAGTVFSFAVTAAVVCSVMALPQQVHQNRALSPGKITLKGGMPEGGRPFMHVVLDEMGSLALMPRGTYYDALHARFVRDYRERGFDIYDDTLATAGATQISLGAVFSQDTEDDDNYHYDGHHFTFDIDENDEVARLAASGYAINGIQNSFLEICDSDRWNCMTYARTGDGAALLRDASMRDGIDYALHEVHSTLASGRTLRASAYYQALTRIGAWIGREGQLLGLFVARPPLVVETMERATPVLANLKPGQAILMHLLLPHFPYVLDEECRMRPTDKVRAPLWVVRDADLPFDFASTERAYWAQAACAHKRTMAMIDAILASPKGKDAVILVHGDHGPRLLEMLQDPENDTATPQERRLALNAFFAVRGAGSIHQRLVSDNRLPVRVANVVDYLLGAAPPDGNVVTSAVERASRSFE